MWLVSVLPIGPVAPQRELSYWSARRQDEGAVVKIPARGREGYGIVVSCAALADARQSVKKARFSLKKISGAGNRVLSRALLRAAYETAALHATSAGAVLSDLIPVLVLKSLPKLPAVSFESRVRESHFERLALCGPREERVRAFDTLARESLAREESLLLIAPTIAEATRIAGGLERHLKDRVHLLHSALSPKQFIMAWQRIHDARACIVVGTPLALCAPLATCGTVVLERESAAGYERDRPFIQLKTAAQELARAFGARFIAAGPVLSIESFAQKAQHELTELPATGRLEQAAVIDMRSKKDDAPPAGIRRPAERQAPQRKPPLQIFSPEAAARIGETLEVGGHAFVLAARKGYASQTACDDCGETFMCPRCGSALILHTRGRAKPEFECHFCGAREGAQARCRNCTSWRLTPLGLGLDRVAAEAERRFGSRAHVADDAALATPARAAKLLRQFNDAKGSVLVGTESAVARLDRIDLSVVASVDSLLQVPEYSATERVFAALAELRGITEGDMLVQTRLPDHAAVSALRAAQPKQLHEHESALRAAFGYPPAATVIRLTYGAKLEALAATRKGLSTALARFEPRIVPARSARIGHSREHVLLRLSSGKWVDPTLLQFLRSLPPSIEIRVNPRSLLGA